MPPRPLESSQVQGLGKALLSWPDSDQQGGKGRPKKVTDNRPLISSWEQASVIPSGAATGTATWLCLGIWVEGSQDGPRPWAYMVALLPWLGLGWFWAFLWLEPSTQSLPCRFARRGWRTHSEMRKDPHSEEMREDSHSRTCCGSVVGASFASALCHRPHMTLGLAQL